MRSGLSKDMDAKLNDILDLRSLLKNGKDKDGNRPNHFTFEILKECERDLGKMIADLYVKKDK